MITIDSRLVAIYNEYCENNKEDEFLMMLYTILDMASPETRDTVSRKHRYEKAKTTRAENKFIRQRIDAYFAKMTSEERIEFLNRPWDEQPEWIKECMTDLVRYPEQFNFLRIAGIVDESKRQKETFGARLVRYMEDHGFTTSDEEGTKLHFENFSKVCNELAQKYDLERRPGRKAQKTRVTVNDLKGYVTKNITPKKDKLTVISAATGIPIYYFGGYDDFNPGKDDPRGPFDPAPFTKFKKKRERKNDAA